MGPLPKPLSRSDGGSTMAYDLVSKNGVVIDGSGLPRYRADVGVKNGRIASIGRIRESAREVVDAEGYVVSPGIIDGHTHMDAQIFWDALGTASPPSSWATAGSRSRRARRRTRRSSCATCSAPRTSRRKRWTPVSRGNGRPSGNGSTCSTACRRASTTPAISVTPRSART